MQHPHLPFRPCWLGDDERERQEAAAMLLATLEKEREDRDSCE